MQVSIVLTVVAALFVGCGNGSGGAVSCDLATTANSPHTCDDYSWTSAAGSPAASATAACTSNGGTNGNGCSHVGAIGGCRQNTTTEGGGTATITQWSYSGTVSTLMTVCAAMPGTWVNP